MDYKTGYSRRLDTAVRQNLLYGIKQINFGVQEQVGKQFGNDGWEISYHPGARPSHVDMGGRQYAIGEKRTVNGVLYPSFDEAKTLLDDYNCLHFKFPIILGVSPPNHSTEELARLKQEDAKTFTYEGKKYTSYEARQMQRKLETAARHAKDRQIIAKEAGDDLLRRQAQEKINALKAQYVSFSRAAGLPVKAERMSISGYRKVKTAEELTNNSKNAIMKNVINTKPTIVNPVNEIQKTTKESLLRIPQTPSSTISQKIKNGEISTIMSKQQYQKHISGTAQYKSYFQDRISKNGNPQSILSISEETAQNIIRNKAGTGIIDVAKNGIARNVEYITLDEPIGYYYGGGKYHETNKAAIHYGKKHAHLVPVKGDFYD